MAKIVSMNPFTLEINGSFETISREALDEKIALANQAFLSWKEVPKSQKKTLFLELARVIESRREELAELQTREMGMLYQASFA